MAAASSPIALRLLGQDHALEPGRDYLLGTADDCDLRLAGGTAASHHARLLVGDDGLAVHDLGSPVGTLHNGQRITTAALAVGDQLRLGEHEATVVPDHGEACIVPLPALRLAVRARRFAAVRAAAGANRNAAPTFEELMAQELRRAPWLGLSTIVHALLLLLLWLWLPDHKPRGRAPTAVAIDLGGSRSQMLDELPALPEVVVEADPGAVVEAPAEPPTEPPALATVAADPMVVPSNPLGGLTGNPRLTTFRAAPSGRAPASGAGADLPGLGSGEFQRTVGDLRRTGLEIVFVFDSTGSMSGTILDTKNTIAQMLSVLRTLVPDARIGLVTYRDRSPNEEYLVRHVPLGADFWRASNFVQFVRAAGGGDRPEDVAAGLQEAFAQSWRPAARRVVILAGDAPPHAEDLQRLLRAVRAFAQNGRSFVHTLVTSPESAGPDTRQPFAAIAKAGKGESLDLEQHERVMQRVLTLAFGREFDRDIASVIETVTAAANRTETWALDLARRGGRELDAALRRQPVDYALLVALTRRPRQQVALELVQMFGDANTPAHTRQAVAWALQRMLELGEPPLDPCHDEVPGAPELRRLHRLAERLPE